MKRQPLSVVIITLNEEDTIGPCLESVRFADEVIIVDSGSTDRTAKLATDMGATVIQQEWLGYGAQKQFGVDRACNDWVLCIDADERVSPELKESILKVLEQPASGAYEMPRCNRFMGRWLRHGEGYPDYSLRLFDRRRASWSDDSVHEKVKTRETVTRLTGDLMHETDQGIEDYLSKQNRYTSLQAETLFRAGRKAGALKVVTSPLFRFIKFYFLRLGFLDGLPGLVHISIGCLNSFMKYAKLRERWNSSS